MNVDKEKEHLIRTCVLLTKEMIDGAHKGRVSESELESLIAVIAGRGTAKDYDYLKSFGVELPLQSRESLTRLWMRSIRAEIGHLEEQQMKKEIK